MSDRLSRRKIANILSTGARIEHTSGPGFKISPQYLSQDEIVYRHKGGPKEGLYSTVAGKPVVRLAGLRTPSWSPDGARFALTSGPLGRPGIYLASSAGGGLTRVATGYGYSTEPRWNPVFPNQIVFTYQSGGLGLLRDRLRRFLDRCGTDGSARFRTGRRLQFNWRDPCRRMEQNRTGGVGVLRHKESRRYGVQCAVIDGHARRRCLCAAGVVASPAAFPTASRVATTLARISSIEGSCAFAVWLIPPVPVVATTPPDWAGERITSALSGLYNDMDGRKHVMASSAGATHMSDG